jgi:CRISPR/Cas system CSM-associated protein Csm3 (group 7 of RAMP superfamily)
LKLKIKINLKITADTPVCIASGTPKAGLHIHKATTKDKDDNLIIPASTIKGRIRAHCEKLLKALNHNLVCESPKSENMCPNSHIIKNPPCPVCRVFGSSFYRSNLFFEDAVWNVKIEDKNLLLEVRPGAGISRKRKTVEERLLYFTETSASGLKPQFISMIEGNLRNVKELALLIAGMKFINSFGAAKSRGLGWSKIDYGIEVEGKGYPEDNLHKCMEELDKWEE